GFFQSCRIVSPLREGAVRICIRQYAPCGIIGRLGQALQRISHRTNAVHFGICVRCDITCWIDYAGYSSALVVFKSCDATQTVGSFDQLARGIVGEHTLPIPRVLDTYETTVFVVPVAGNANTGNGFASYPPHGVIVDRADLTGGTRPGNHPG